MSSRDDAALRSALLDLEDAYARIDDQAAHIAALELENRRHVPRAELPRVVCVCGSTRFTEDINDAAEQLTLDGAIVVRPDVSTFITDDPAIKARLDELHFRKIDLADEVLVVAPGGYIGHSTRREIAYATEHGKRVRYTAAPRCPNAVSA